MPRLDTLQKIAAAYDVSISFLAGDEDANLDLAVGLANQSLRILFAPRELDDGAKNCSRKNRG